MAQAICRKWSARARKAGAVLLPFTRVIVPTVDLAAGRIVADPPEGLLE